MERMARSNGGMAAWKTFMKAGRLNWGCEIATKCRAALEAVPVAIFVGSDPVPIPVAAETFTARHSPLEPSGPDELTLRLVAAESVDYAMQERSRLLSLLDDCQPTDRPN